ncbi:acyltransferase family protein [Spongisporangium articulatum]|uniref:Acyltransferase family protein n=1 Tax=Spongisporangium articulatum TaxID=3362603 RepID=A0ABW8APQ8_9ACTN
MWAAATRETDAAAQPAQDPAEAPARGEGRRPALDGVRAVAVLAVAVYHFGGGDSSWLPGGFLGVDVFFVLSGYLITGLLLAEWSRTGSISLTGFWMRRVKRLAPALLLVLVVVAAWVWWTTPPTDYPARRADILWTLGYLANWHLAAVDNYFAAFGSVSPLRHTWSLAVEEQFYLVWPLITLACLWAGRRLGGRRLGGRRVLVAVALVGALASAVEFAALFDPVRPTVAYYSTRGRVQELFAGALLALAFAAFRRRARPALVSLVGPAGVAGLVVGFLTMPDTTAFYYRGGAALVSLAAVGLIGGVEAAPDGRLARMLSWGPAAWLGRVSYGVYLWHWPVTVAVPAAGSDQVLRQVLRVLLTLGLASASFYLLERPVQRSRRALGTPPRTLVALLTSAAVVVGVGVQATALPGTLFEQAETNSDRACPGERADRLLVCAWPAGASVAAGEQADLAIVGDSTVRALSGALDEWATSSGSTWVEAAWRQCSSIGALTPTAANATDALTRACHEQAPTQVSRMLATYRPKVVLIGDFWIHENAVQVNGDWVRPGTDEHAAELERRYLDLVDEIAAAGGRAVFLELPPPGDQLGVQFAAGRPAATAKPPAAYGGKFVDGFNAVLRRVAAQRPDVARSISVTDVVCPGGSCPAAVGDRLIRVDGVHYSVPFAAEVTPVILQRAGITPPS